MNTEQPVIHTPLTWDEAPTAQIISLPETPGEVYSYFTLTEAGDEDVPLIPEIMPQKPVIKPPIMASQRSPAPEEVPSIPVKELPVIKEESKGQVNQQRPPSPVDKVPQPEPVPQTRQEYVAGRDEEILLQFDHNQWLLLDIEGPQEGIILQGKTYNDEGSQFHFITKESGEYLLTFQMQSLEQGISKQEKVPVLVSQEEAEPLEPQLENPPHGDEVGRISLLGEEEKAIVPPAAFQRIPVQMGIPSDKLLYRLARYWEKPGPGRDLHNALEAYKKLQRGFPQSEFYFLASERITYMEQHYFLIR